ncbi:hypothetical protein LIER_27230 [Lithospermum erythrorhizon]|uniref:Phytocyanin domain-containing protein n=1 Tax=Lithospermum erythrorhizon TaxID=34254 RepID=A0AAV3REV9_LITER
MAASFTRAFVGTSMVVLLSLVSVSEARDHLIGGKTDSWQMPPSKSTDTFNRWSSKTRFLIGDSLVWKYDGSKDSVVQVNKKDYVNCNVTSPIAVHNDGNTVVELDHSGPYYFISGAQGHCEKGQKIIVVVLSEKHSRRFMGVSPAPTPYGNDENESPALAPTSNAHGLVKGGLVATFGFGVLSFVLMM